jgi:hypothetical protein
LSLIFVLFLSCNCTVAGNTDQTKAAEKHRRSPDQTQKLNLAQPPDGACFPLGKITVTPGAAECASRSS